VRTGRANGGRLVVFGTKCKSQNCCILMWSKVLTRLEILFKILKAKRPKGLCHKKLVQIL